MLSLKREGSLFQQIQAIEQFNLPRTRKKPNRTPNLRQKNYKAYEQDDLFSIPLVQNPYDTLYEVTWGHLFDS